MDKKLIRLNYLVGNTLYIKCFAVKVYEYDQLDDPVDFFTTLLAERRNVSKEDIILHLFLVCDSDDKIEYFLEFNKDK
jgi:hypothetical protein